MQFADKRLGPQDIRNPMAVVARIILAQNIFYRIDGRMIRKFKLFAKNPRPYLRYDLAFAASNTVVP